MSEENESEQLQKVGEVIKSRLWKTMGKTLSQVGRRCAGQYGD